nr:hypothetical protein [Tanacetum cinerariifolium]
MEKEMLKEKAPSKLTRLVRELLEGREGYWNWLQCQIQDSNETEQLFLAYSCQLWGWSGYSVDLTPTAITNCVSGIEPLNGTKFSSWREQVKISFGITDLDYALRFDKPNPLTAISTVNEKRTYEIRERSNRMIMKNSISVAILGAIPDSENAKDFLKSVEEQFKGSSKANVSTIIFKMLTTKFDGLSEFGPSKISYNTKNKKWKMSELIAMCVQEKKKLKIEKPNTAYLTTTKGHIKKNLKVTHSDNASSNNGKESSPKCRICKNPDYFQNECPKF